MIIINFNNFWGFEFFFLWEVSWLKKIVDVIEGKGCYWR